MDQGTRQISDQRIVAGLTRLKPSRAILVLGTPAKEDLRGRMEQAIRLVHSLGSVIIALGNEEEAGYMLRFSLEHGVAPENLIVDGRSRTTLDNAYFGKKICRQSNLRPDILVASQYQIWRAALTFKRVFGLGFSFRLYPSLSQTSTTRRLRETILIMFTPLLFLFRAGDEEGLKRASDILWKLFFR